MLFQTDRPTESDIDKSGDKTDSNANELIEEPNSNPASKTNKRRQINTQSTTADGTELQPQHKMPPTKLRDKSEVLNNYSLNGNDASTSSKKRMWETS